MTEDHPRSMDGNWGSGGDVPWPVECLLNGINSTDPNLIFGGGHALPTQFRHRFHAQAPSMHISNGLPLSSSVNVSIPSHPMVEETEQPEDLNNGSSTITGDVLAQDHHSHTVASLSLNSNVVLDDTDDASDEDEEDDDADEQIIMAHNRRGDSLSHPHQMGDSSMLHCQHQVPVRDNLSAMIMPTNHSLPKLNSGVILRTGLANEHSLQPHSHQTNPMMPQFPPLEEFETTESQQNQGNNDPNCGYSVYGKMYFEGRIVLHLKQGTYNDEEGSIGMSNNVNGMNFSSCAESDPRKGQQFHGCAACKLRSPINQESHRRQRDSHRHTIKGVLFTFEDCTIVELYPDQLPSGNLHNNPNELKPRDQGNKICLPNNQPMPMNSYIVDSNNHKQRLIQQQMEIDQLNVQEPNVNGPQAPPPPSHQQMKASNPNEDHTSWWDEFESEGDPENELKETETTEEESNHAPDVPLSCMNHKLNNGSNGNSDINHLTSEQHLLHENTNGNDDEQEQEAQEETGNEYPKYKCNMCSGGLLSRNQLESHICVSHTLSQNQNSTNSSVPPSIELDMSSSSNNSNSNNASFETNTSEEGAVTTPILTELEHRNEISSVDGDVEDSCHSALNIITNDNTFEQIEPSSSSISKKLGRITKLNPKYSCTSCDKTFRLKKALKQHQKECQSLNWCNSTMGNSVKCSNCSLHFESEIALVKHACSSKLKMTTQRKKITPKSKLRPKKSNNKREDYVLPNDLKRSDANHDEGVKCNKKMKFSTSQMEQNPESSTNEIHQQDSSTLSQEYYYSSDHENLDDSSRSCDSINKNHSESSSQYDEYEDQNELEFDFKMKTITNGKTSPSSESREDKEATNDVSCDSTIDGKYKCEMCGKCFSIKRKLESHKLAHRSEKSSSQCEKCGKRFARKDKLMRHMYVHSEEKMFVCHICDKRFSRRDKLSDHLKSHGTADEIHHCPMCKKEFLRPDILKQHVKLHGMGNKHQCPDCFRFVTGKERFEKHMSRHEEAKALGQTLQCPLCTKYFIQRQSLKAHFKKFHPDSQLSIDAITGPMSTSPPLEELNLPLQNTSNLAATLITNNDYCKLNIVNSDASISAEGLSENNSESSKRETYSCRQCPKQFTKKLSLKKHERKHQHEQHLNSGSNPDILCTSQDEVNHVDGCGNLLESSIERNTPIDTGTSQLIDYRLPPASVSASSPVSAHSASPPTSVAIELPIELSVQLPSPAHTALRTQQPPTSPQLSLNSLAHQNLMSMASNLTTTPPPHIPLSLAAAAAAVSVAPSISQQNSNNLLGINGQGSHLSLHSHASHHLLQHTHQTSASHPSLSCSHGQIHPQLTHHLSMSPLQHMNVGMTPSQSMFYYPYSYQ